MLSESVAIADSITSSPVYAPWSIVESACTSQVITDLRACWDWVVLCRRTAKDTRGENFRCCWGGARWICVSCFAGSWSSQAYKNRSSPSKWKSQISQSPMKLPRKIEISSPPASSQRRSLVADPIFASTLAAQASCGKSRPGGRDRRATPVFQMGFS